MARDIPGLRWLGRTLEGVMFGAQAARYRLFVRAVVVVTIGLGLANAVVWADLVALQPQTAALLETAGAVALAAFILVGALQVIVMARLLDRETEAVADQAETLADSADEVTETAADLETTADELESRAEKLEAKADELAEKAADASETGEAERSPDELADAAAELREEAAELRDETADAKAQTHDVKETSEDVAQDLAAERERLPDEDKQ